MIKKYIYGLVICLVFNGIMSTSYTYGESGASGGGSGLISVPTPAAGAPTTATFITQTPDAGLSAEQALNTLSDGLLKHASGVVAQAVSGTDYITPTGTETLTNKTITDLSNMIHADGGHVGVRNVSGSTINKGDAVYVSGYNVGQDKIEISLADADVAGSMPSIGLVEADILNNANGLVLVSGVLANIDTSSFSVSDVLYVSTTAGALTATRPSINGDLVQAIAKVNRSHATLGVVLIQGAGRTNDIPNNLTMINTGAFRTGTTAADTAVLAAYDVDGASYTILATLTANNDPAFDLNAITTIGTNAIADSSDNLSFFSATTSAQLAGILSNETGTLLSVFSDSPTFTTLINLPNTGLHILDTNASHDLIIAPGSDITADRILTLTTGDAARTITLNGNPTLNDWFDQSVKSDDSPTFTGTNLGVAGSITGILTLSGSTSGTITLQPAAVAGTYTLTLPTDAGSVGQFLQTNGSGVLTWAAGTSDAFSSMWYHGAEVTTTITLNTFAKITHFVNTGEEDGNSNAVGDPTTDDDITIGVMGAGTFMLHVQASFRNASGSNKNIQINPKIILATALTITDATNATPIVVTVDAPHTLKVGDMTTISGVGGNTAANADHYLSAVTSTTMTLQTLAHVDVAGNGAYTSGGTVDALYPGNTMLEGVVSGSDLERGAGSGTVSLAASDVLELHVANISDSNDVLFSQLQFGIERIK